MHMPPLGLGTFRLTGDTVIRSVRDALELGYRAIDTAQIYGNEADIGQAIGESGIPREQLHLTTKIWTANYSASRLVPSLRESLDRLRCEQVDLCLIHWPAPDQPVAAEEYLLALAEARTLGLTRRIGLSNFNIAGSRQAIELLGADAIACNQIELSPYLQNRRLTRWLHTHGIGVTSYMTLAYGKVLQDETLGRIAEKHRTGVAQIALAWAMHLGYAVIPSSTRREHLAANLQARELTLEAEDLTAIAALERGQREVDPAGLAPVWD